MPTDERFDRIVVELDKAIAELRARDEVTAHRLRVLDDAIAEVMRSIRRANVLIEQLSEAIARDLP